MNVEQMTDKEWSELKSKIQAKADEIGMSYSAVAGMFLDGCDERIVEVNTKAAPPQKTSDG